jgi:hypothetical protein
MAQAEAIDGMIGRLKDELANSAAAPGASIKPGG